MPGFEVFGEQECQAAIKVFEGRRNRFGFISQRGDVQEGPLNNGLLWRNEV
jgi:hypothetical protein